MKRSSLEYRAILNQMNQNLNLFDDIFARIVFKDKLATQYVLRALLESDDIVVDKVIMQYRITLASGKEIVADVYVKDTKGNVYIFEIQKGSIKFSTDRAEFYASALDGELLKSGEDYSKLGKRYVIILHEEEPFEEGQLIYDFSRQDEVSGRRLTKSRIMYFNAAGEVEYVEDEFLKELLEYFKNTDPTDMRFGELSERVEFLKGTRKGQEEMSEVLERYVEVYTAMARAEGREEGIVEGKLEGKVEGRIEYIMSMYERGFGLDIIADILKLSVGEVQEIIIANS